jgi:multiple sugar transport system permease protein
LLLNRSSIVGKIFEKVLILPLMIAPVIAAVVWKLMFNPQFGILNHVLGLGSTFDWLNRERALWSTVLVDLWIYTPFVAILVLAGIRSLPKEPFEASDVDGAGFLYMFRRLMLPMMWPYILVAVIFRFMDCLKIFDIVYVLTAGGPGDATTTISYYMYQTGFQFYRFGYASAIGLVTFVGVLVLTLVTWRAQRGRALNDQ